MNTGEKFIDIPKVDVCGKRTLEYVAESLARFNRGADEVILRSISGNVSRAMEVAQILSDGFDIEIESANVHKLEINGIGSPCLELTLRSKTTSGGPGKANYSTESGFVEFPIYHLLLDLLLSEKKSLHISKRNGTPLATIVKSNWEMRCKCNADEQDIDTLNSLVAAYYRSGLLPSPNWSKIAQYLSQFDDIIIGVDTNILHDASLSEQLLNSLSLIDPKQYVHTPSWLLIVIPSAVMHEVEQATNARDQKGSLTLAGRMGFRALQEILELDQSADLMGVSLIIVGEANPVLDTRVELRGLREDMAKRSPQPAGGHLSTKLSTGDTIIRDQFKHFLRQLDFHKGAYFLTADKSNAALAKTEGLHPVYQKVPPWYAAKDEIEPPRILCEPGPEVITLAVPLGKLVYEVAVQFGSIKIGWDTDEIEIACDDRGESLDHWIYKDLRVGGRHLEKLMRNYDSVGKFSLVQAKNVWDEFAEKIGGVSTI